MRDVASFLALPAAVLTLIATPGVVAEELQWPYNLPPTIKYFPEDEAHVKRDAEAQQRLSWQAPVGMKKMNGDATEKFWPQYWDFGEGFKSEEQMAYSNESLAPEPLDAAIALHTNHDRPRVGLFGRSLFVRDFSCPSDTESCTSIGSSLCCPSGQSCVSVSGGVGCCSSGSTCGSTAAPCATASGYTDCPNSPNGGCCVSGASCAGTGCVFVGTQTVQVTASTDVITNSASDSTASDTDETTTSAIPNTLSGYTTTVTVTQSQSGSVTTIVSPTTVLVAPSTSSTLTSQSALACSSGFQSCPATLGGGCCPTGQICGTGSLCINSTTATTTTATAGAPILPTSVQASTSATAVSAATVVSSTTSNLGCPTGYYMCSAYYLGGCCQVGQNCDTTNCPSTASTVVVTSQPTVVVPYTSTTTAGAGAGAAAVSQGSCANGWYSCGASDGGGCCPSGLICGTASCSATVSGQQNTGKEAPSSANIVAWAWGFLILAMSAGIGMVWL